MRIGAILTVARARQAEGTFPITAARETKQSARFLADNSYVLVDVLGESILDRTITQLKEAGTLPPTVIPAEGTAAKKVLPIRSASPHTLLSVWESAVASYISNGVDLLLLVRVNAYTDLDYRNLIQYHLETQSPLTQVYAADGALDIAIVDASLLRSAEGGYRKALRTLIPRQRQFAYNGYVNRLRQPHEFYQLVMDALAASCGLRPSGHQIQPGIWVGENTQIDSGAFVTGPAFIGADVCVETCCRIAGPSSIERGCTIDCGTTVSESCVLPGTYIGVALEVRHSIVSSRKLFHLKHNIEVNIADHRLIGANARPMPFLSGLGSLLWGEAQAGD